MHTKKVHAFIILFFYVVRPLTFPIAAKHSQTSSCREKEAERERKRKENKRGREREKKREKNKIERERDNKEFTA